MDLSKNTISSLPSDFVSLIPEIEVINLEENRLKMLPSDIYKLSCLRELNLACNELTELPIELGEGISRGKHSKLVKVSLMGNRCIEI